ncbi:MAG: hypothetical protein JXR03_06115 [Cyclobacteriaceae bacterium]
MLRISLYLASFLVFYSVHSQIGDLPITNHRPSISGLENSGFDMEFDSLGLMYVASNEGILQYDGRKWEQIATPKAAFSLDVDGLNRVYVGCAGSFGYLHLTNRGVAYKKISPDSLANEYFVSTQALGDSIVFLSSNSLWVYRPSTEALHTYSSPDKYDLTAVVSDGEDIYISTEISSFKWVGDEMTALEKWIGSDFPPAKIEKSPDGEGYLVLDVEGKLFFSRGGDRLRLVTSIDFKVNDFEWIDESHFVLSTRNQGCQIFDFKTLSVVNNINYSGGLPDNEVKALRVDENNGVWIAHAFGFSRVDTEAPVSCLSNQAGLEGHLIQSVSFKNQLIVGTSSGVFRSKLDSVFSITTSKKRIKSTSRSTSTQPSVKSGGLFKKKRGTSTKTITQKTTYRYVTEEEKKFEYAEWRYGRLGGINQKCNDFYVLGDVLLIGTNGGLFEYDGEELIRITNQPVKSIAELPSENEFLVIDEYSAERYIKQEDKYAALAFDYNESLVVSAYGDDRGLLWLVGPGTLTSVGLTINGASVFDNLELPNDHLEKPTIAELGDKLVIITNGQFLSYNYKSKSLNPDLVMLKELGIPKRHIQDKNGTFWMFDGKVWKYVDNKGEATTYSYLSLYPEISTIGHDREKGNVYFITKEGELFRYDPESDNNEVNPSNIFYKYLFALSNYTTYKSEIKLPYDENYLKAEISQPDYLGLLNVEYKYKLEGVDKDWSSWSPSNQIDLAFLPEGRHTLHVSSRDIFGREQSLQPVKVVIRPPYWRTTWFYLMEVVFFAFLVWASTRLNQASASNRFLTEGLTVLTVVLIIETLQSMAGSFFFTANSPIIDFMINLAIALVIFPLELLLKRIIKGRRLQRSAEG